METQVTSLEPLVLNLEQETVIGSARTPRLDGSSHVQGEA